MKNSMRFWVLLFSFWSGSTQSELSIQSEYCDPLTTQLTVSFDIGPADYLYEEFLHVSVDHPDIAITNLTTSETPITHFDSTFNTEKKIFNKPFTMNITLTRSSPTLRAAHVRISYYQHSQKKIIEKMYPLSFASSSESAADEQTIPSSVYPLKATPRTPAISWSTYLQNLLAHTHSGWLRLTLAFILGLLLSLTPCIYPMIPITVGILQANARKTLLSNFLLAASYTSGIATTFALLGLMAAFTGQVFGTFMQHPVVILLIVAFLIYLALSMLGCYEMYVPSFLNNSTNSAQGGSFLAAFTFGAMSGTVASPCLSPGLLLLLTIVSTLGNIVTGFVLLFAFGVGLSVPLLIIGTFSSSLNALPRAGAWMVEIKKIFGLMMLAMCFYFLRPLMPLNLFMWALTLFVLGSGVFALFQSLRLSSFKKLYTIGGMLLVMLSVYLGIKALQITYLTPAEKASTTAWFSDYHKARYTALQNNTCIFLFVSGPFCSICKAIENRILKAPVVQQELEKFVLMKIDNMHADAEHTALCKRFKVLGAPTFIIFNPEDETECARWGSELYDKKAVDFAQQLTALSE